MRKTLKKIQEEILKADPDLSYIRGMIEVLVDEDEVHIEVPAASVNTIKSVMIDNDVKGSVNGEKMDEAAILDATAKASLATIKALAEKGNE